MKPSTSLSTLLLCAVLPALVASFSPSNATDRLSSPLNMVPRYDASTQRWTPETEEESAAAGYPAIRSLLRHGPGAFITRVTNPDLYDQAVMKFMANDKVGRWEAQGNMDRCNENAQDWMYERMEADSKGKKLDYVTLNPKQVILSCVWAGIVFWFANDLLQKYVF